MGSVNKLAESTNEKFGVLTASMERLSDLINGMANNQQPKQGTNTNNVGTPATASD